MDRITHQSPRQRGYGSTSRLRNDSLKRTRKHERRRQESNQETRQPGSGGLSGQAGWTVRKGHADCPIGYRGLSAPLPRTVPPEPRTVRKRQQNLQRRNANNGPSAGSTRTVRQAPADCPPSTRGPSETSPNQNSKTPRIESEAEQEHEEHATNMNGADRPPGPRGPSARHGQSRKLLDPRRSTPPIHHRISQTVEAVETRVWGQVKSQTRMLYPKNFAS
jgi:hypothetical protein